MRGKALRGQAGRARDESRGLVPPCWNVKYDVTVRIYQSRHIVVKVSRRECLPQVSDAPLTETAIKKNQNQNKLSDDGTVTIYDESEWVGWSRAGRFRLRPYTVLESDNETEYRVLGTSEDLVHTESVRYTVPDSDKPHLLHKHVWHAATLIIIASRFALH